MVRGVIFEQIIFGELDMLSFNVQETFNTIHDDNEDGINYYYYTNWKTGCGHILTFDGVVFIDVDSCICGENYWVY